MELTPFRASFWCLALLWQGVVLGVSNVLGAWVVGWSRAPLASGMPEINRQLAVSLGGALLYVGGVVFLVLRYRAGQWPFALPQQAAGAEGPEQIEQSVTAGELRPHWTRHEAALIVASLLAGVGAGSTPLLFPAGIPQLSYLLGMLTGIVAGVVWARRPLGLAMLIVFFLSSSLLFGLTYGWSDEEVWGVTGMLLMFALLSAGARLSNASR